MFAFAYGSTYAWNATSASSRFIGRRWSSGPNSKGFGCPALPRKLPMTEVSGLKTLDAPGIGGVVDGSHVADGWGSGGWWRCWSLRDVDLGQVLGIRVCCWWRSALRLQCVELLTDRRHLLIQRVEPLLELFDAVFDIRWRLLRKQRRGREEHHEGNGAMTKHRVLLVLACE